MLYRVEVKTKKYKGADQGHQWSLVSEEIFDRDEAAQLVRELSPFVHEASIVPIQ